MTSPSHARWTAPPPRTTFDRIREPREWDDILMAGLPGVIVLLLAPLALIVAALTTLLVRGLRLRWWSPLPVAAIGAGWILGIGPARAWADYTELLPLLSAAIEHQAVEIAREVLVEWLPRAAPISIALGGLLSTGWCAFAEVRHPSYRTASTRQPHPRRLARTADRIRSGVADPDEGVALGMDPNGRPVTLTGDELAVHGLVVGGTGSGKTTAMLQLLRGRTARGSGGGLVYVDLKGEHLLIHQLARLAAAHGRRFHLWTMDGPTVWNPLRRGGPTEQRDKLMAALGPYSEEFYEAAARRFLQTVLNVLHHPMTGPNRPITIADVDRLLDLDLLRARALGSHDDDRPLAALDPLAEEVDTLIAEYRADRQLRAAVAGWRTRLATLRSATVGRWLTGDGLDLHETLAAGDIVLFSLDASRYQDAAAGIARAVVRDLVTVAAEMQARPTGSRSGTVVLDEFAAAAGDDLLALFARGRSAGVSTWLVTQDLADLDAAGGAFAAQVVANTNVKVIGRVDVSESAEALAALAGTEQVWEETVQVTTDAPHLAPARGGATGMGSLRRTDRFRLHPNEVKELGRGHVVLLVKHPAWRLERVVVVPADPAVTNDTRQRRAPAQGAPR